MSSFKSPAYNVKAVPVEKIVANSYNPNVVAPPEMKLLELSIWEDGYTMPLVCYYREEEAIIRNVLIILVVVFCLIAILIWL